jgi:serine-type D-Ala-D-Ala carboxypeptidase (penicillin-binding protein 5/6)
MVEENTEARRKGPAHARRGGLTKESSTRLGELGRQVPPLTGDALREMTLDWRATFRRSLAVVAVVVVVAALVLGVGFQWFRPLPHPAFRSSLSSPVVLPGQAPALPWPTQGAASVAVEGVGSLGQSGGTQPRPIAGLADVLTAYVILHDHPFAADDVGPSITVTAPTIAAYQAGQAAQETEVTVTSGETLSERDALEAMLVAGGNDMADLLANWDAGSTTAFVAKMNTAAHTLGLTTTRITDPSGVDPGTVSTPEDLVTLGEAAMADGVFRQIVDEGQVTPPGAKVSYNLNFDLGRDGIIGVKTGSDSQSQGCYLFAASQPVGGQTVTVVGAVLGQLGGSLGPNTAAVDAGDLLAKAAFASVGTLPVLSAGQVVGHVNSPWGGSTPVIVSTAVSILGRPGLMVPVTVHTEVPKAPIPAGTTVGSVTIAAPGHSTQVPLRTSRPLGQPSAWWKLTRT